MWWSEGELRRWSAEKPSRIDVQTRRQLQMKRIWLVLLAGALLAWNAFAQESRPARERPERSAPPQAEKKGSGTEASANASASTSASAQAGENSPRLPTRTPFGAA